ncbi:oligosaccharide flippase family protein [Proteobacteria bacterium 005FR1]|nr:oligosaccharide flippase family protein [Proteobacteria bacterium 005FR1]
MSQTKRMIKHSSIYAVGNFSRQIVGFLMLPVYTRYLEPADYGVVGLLIFMVSLIEILFGARLFQAVPKFYYEQKNKDDSHSVISTAFLLTSAISVVSVLAVIVFRDSVSAVMFGSAKYSLVVAIFSVMILTHALENYSLGYIRIQKRPWLFVGASSVKLVLQLGMNVWLVVFLEWGVMGVALANAVASVVFTAGMTVYTLRNTGIDFSRAMAKKMLIFSWPIWLSGMAGLYIGSSNRYFLRIFSSLDDVGLFELAAKFGTIISLLVWTPFAQYWQVERFDLYHQANPLPIYQSVFKMISTLLVIAGLGIAIFSAPVIRIMAAPEFYPAAKAVPFLVFAGVFHCFTIFNNFSFLVKEKTSWMTFNSYATAVVVSIFYFVLIPAYGFVGAAQALMLAHLVQFLLSHFMAKRSYDMGISLRPIALYLCVSVAALSFTYNRDFDGLLADIGARMAVYVVACMLVGAYVLSHAGIREYLSGLWHRKLGSQQL